MKVHRSITLAILRILVAGAIVSFQLGGAETMTQTSENQTMPLPLLNYLAEMAKHYDRFFTVEEAWRPDKPKDSIDNNWLPRPSEKRGLEQELAQLRRVVPNLIYEIDKRNPRVVHIMDARLAQQKEYGLESAIRSIDFTGKVNDLPSEIGKQGIPLSPLLITFKFEQADYSTEVRVRGEELKVRDALSNFVPLQGRTKRILWIARTKLGQGEVTYVYYP